MSLTTEYPLWFIVFCLIAGGSYAALLYYRQKDQELYSDYPIFKYLLPFLRFISVSILAFFLLNPLLSSRSYDREKPILLVGFDKSNSIRYWDSGMTKAYTDFRNEMADKLSDRFQIEFASFGKGIEFSPDFQLDAPVTSISEFLSYAKREYQNQNFGGAVLISDGIYNAGSDPAFIAKQLTNPVFTLGLGDTSIRTDLLIANALHNSIAYLGNDFPVRIELRANRCKNRQASLICKVNGEKILQKPLGINEDSYYNEEEIKLKATRLGSLKIELELNVFEDEVNIANNRMIFYVDVVDSRKKVQIWSSAPHPDIGAIRSLIDKNDNYECSLALGNWSQNLDDNPDIVVLHNWFGNQAELKAFESLKAKEIATWLIIGNRFQSNLFNQATLDMEFTSLGSGENVVQAIINPGFEYFETDEALSEHIQSWSPLSVPFGEFTGYKESDVVLFQKIGNVKTKEPLLLVQQRNSYRFACLAGTGFWQWRLLDYEANSEHRLTTELIQRIIQYIAVKDEKKRLKVRSTERSFGLNEEITLMGELYNQTFQSVANQEISVLIRDEDGKDLKRLMDPMGSNYMMRIKNLPPGLYNFRAETELGAELLEDHGYFTVYEQDLEQVDLTANHQLLKQIAGQTEGKYFNWESRSKLAVELEENEAMKIQIIEQESLNELISLKWVFWLLLGLLSMEWLIRKIIGGY